MKQYDVEQVLASEAIRVRDRYLWKGHLHLIFQGRSSDSWQRSIYSRFSMTGPMGDARESIWARIVLFAARQRISPYSLIDVALNDVKGKLPTPPQLLTD